jgi:predicted DNA-binding transcriptional regulator YafY
VNRRPQRSEAATTSNPRIGVSACGRIGAERAQRNGDQFVSADCSKFPRDVRIVNVRKSKSFRLPATRMSIARMQFIYEAIKAERRPNCTLLARKLEVSAKTVQRDIDYMRYQLNLPIEYDQERHGLFFTEPVSHFPSVHITESELVALLVARKAIEQYANTPFQKPLVAAFQKLTSGLDDRVSFNWQELERTFDFRPIGISKQNLAVFETVAAGLREERELELQYRKLGANRPELRRVQPYSLVCVENQWYLRAWDLVRRDLRTFHLGRISQATRLPHRFRRPTGFDMNESLLDSIGVYVGSKPENVVLRFTGWASTVVAERAWHPSQSVREREDGAVEVKLKVSINPEFERWLWSWGDAVEVISPMTLRDGLRAAHQRAAVRNR